MWKLFRNFVTENEGKTASPCCPQKAPWEEI